LAPKFRGFKPGRGRSILRAINVALKTEVEVMSGVDQYMDNKDFFKYLSSSTVLKVSFPHELVSNIETRHASL
jgi:hypothetical protein